MCVHKATAETSELFDEGTCVKGINEYVIYEEMWACLMIKTVSCVIYLEFSVKPFNIFLEGSIFCGVGHKIRLVLKYFKHKLKM